MAGASTQNEARQPSSRAPSEITRLLRAHADGDDEAFDLLLPRVYDALRRVARRQLRGERRDHTLTPTALVHEAYIELTKVGDLSFNDRRHFFAAAAQTMRHILVDYAVRRRAQKRGGDRHEVPFDDVVLSSDQHIEELVTIDQALCALEQVDGRLVRVVEYRFFVGLTIAETAEVLDVSDATVSRCWTRARAWLNREIMRGASERPSAPVDGAGEKAEADQAEGSMAPLQDRT